MAHIELISSENQGISDRELSGALEKSIAAQTSKLKKVLLLPPDFTRMHSGAGKITAWYYRYLKDFCEVRIMPALGTHMPMSSAEIKKFFPGIPEANFLVHNWRTDVVRIGRVPGAYVEEVSGGLLKEEIDVEINKQLLDKSYDLIISIGQVVPHEVVGMSNYSKNIFVGCGGSSMINQSHMLGAFYGLEKIMGKDCSPVRKVFDYAEEHFIQDLPIMYVLTVTSLYRGNVGIDGLFVGRERRLFEKAVELSQKKNITFVDKPLKKVVVYLDESEFKSTWLGNKAVYRTRMAIADGGELIVLGPGIQKFGEDDTNDRLIRKYGYVGREKILKLSRENEDLQKNLSVAAHLIHGSSDGRFSITYAAGHLTMGEVENANFRYMPLEEAYRKYPVKNFKDGYNTLENGEDIYFISNPALGLWACREKFNA